MAFISNLSAPSLFWTVNSILVFIVCALSAGVLIPLILLISFCRNLFDMPDERKIHQGVVPRLGGTALYRVLGKEGEETQCPTSQTPVTMILKGDFISGQNFQKEMTMTLTPAGVVPGLGAILLNNTIGERVEAIIPANLGYGYYDYRGIPAGSTLIFTYTIEKFN